MKNSVGAIVVTYNRKELLLKNLYALLNQSYKMSIFIIDNNSNDGTKELLEEKNILTITSVHYYNTGKNLGGAGGFAYGLELAMRNNYDFFWLMDDDGRPLDNKTLENLMNVACQFTEKNIIFNSLVMLEDRETLSFGLNNIKTVKEAIAIAKDNCIYGINNPFNGTLISKEIIEKIGIPRGDFVIGYDEVEYMERHKYHEGIIITVVNSGYYHPIPYNEYKIILGKRRSVTPPSWKHYYRVRNTINTMIKYNSKYTAVKFGLKALIGSVVFSPGRRLETFSTTVSGIKDGMLNKFDKTEIHIK